MWWVWYVWTCDWCAYVWFHHHWLFWLLRMILNTARLRILFLTVTPRPSATVCNTPSTWATSTWCFTISLIILRNVSNMALCSSNWTALDVSTVASLTSKAHSLAFLSVFFCVLNISFFAFNSKIWASCIPRLGMRTSALACAAFISVDSVAQQVFKIWTWALDPKAFGSHCDSAVCTSLPAPSLV